MWTPSHSRRTPSRHRPWRSLPPLTARLGWPTFGHWCYPRVSETRAGVASDEEIVVSDAADDGRPWTLMVGCRNPQRQMVTKPKGQQFQWLSSGESSLGSKPE
jgi:hypothetical protein